MKAFFWKSASLCLLSSAAIAGTGTTKNLCGNFEGKLTIPEIAVKVSDGAKAIAVPAFASVILYDGERTKFDVPDRLPLPVPFAAATSKQIPLPIRLNDSGDGYVVGPLELTLEGKARGVFGSGGSCTQWVQGVVLNLNSSPWECRSSQCYKLGENKPTPKNTQFFLGPDGLKPYKHLFNGVAGNIEQFRPDLVTRTIDILETKPNQPFKQVEDLRARLSQLSSAGATVALTPSASLQGNAVWIEDYLRGMQVGISLSDGSEDYYILWQHDRSKFDPYIRCLQVAATSGKTVTLFGELDRPMGRTIRPPALKPVPVQPGEFNLTGVDSATWEFCRDTIAGGKMLTPEQEYNQPGIVSFRPENTSSVSTRDVRRLVP